MQTAHVYNLNYLRLLERLMSSVDAWPAEIGAFQSDYEAFGSWTIVIRRLGTRTRIDFDGRDRYLEARRLQPDAGDHTVQPRPLGGIDLPHGLTDASFDAVLEFIRTRT